MFPPDPCLRLEDVHGERALAWARERNTHSQAMFEAALGFVDSGEEILAVLNYRDQSPVWRAVAFTCGIFRKTPTPNAACGTAASTTCDSNDWFSGPIQKVPPPPWSRRASRGTRA